MNKVIIYGLGDNAELAKFYFENDSSYEVVAFTVESAFKDKDQFHNLPVIEFENLENKYPPAQYKLFIAVGYSNMNEIRERIYNQAKRKGYNFANYISSKATIWTKEIGENNFILEDNTIQPYVKIGSNNVIWSGNHIGHHGFIGNHCFITSQVTISGRCVIEDNCFIGVNATIRDHIIIKYKSLIGAGAWIAKNTEPYQVYVATAAKLYPRSSLEVKI